MVESCVTLTAFFDTPVSWNGNHVDVVETDVPPAHHPSLTVDHPIKEHVLGASLAAGTIQLLVVGRGGW